MEKLVLIDGSSLACRAYFVAAIKFQDELKEIKALELDGDFDSILKIENKINPIIIENTKSIYKKFLTDIYSRERQDYNVVAWDAESGTKTFRGDLYPSYKGNRDSKSFPAGLFLELENVSSNLGYFNSKMIGFEADDIIGTLSELSKGKNIETVIISSDKDLLQLVSDSDNIKVQLPKTGMKVFSEMKEQDILDLYGISVDKLVDFKALVGDSSDNYPGIKGIGPKTGKDLLNQFYSINGIYNNLDKLSKSVFSKLENQEENAQLFYKIAKIVTDIQLPFSIQDTKR